MRHLLWTDWLIDSRVNELPNKKASGYSKYWLTCVWTITACHSCTAWSRCGNWHHTGQWCDNRVSSMLCQSPGFKKLSIHICGYETDSQLRKYHELHFESCLTPSIYPAGWWCCLFLKVGFKTHIWNSTANNSHLLMISNLFFYVLSMLRKEDKHMK